MIGPDTTSVWRATVGEREPATDIDLPASADVIVAGGGITGLTTAWLLTIEGLDVVVLERRSVGAGTTGNTTAKVTALHGLCYAGLVEGVGVERARMYAEANVAAVDLVRQLATDLAPESQPTDAPALTFAWSSETTEALQREVEAGTSLGLPIQLVRDTDLPFAVAAAVRLERQMHFHPLQYLVGLSAAIERNGGVVLEGTPVTSVDDRDDGVVVHTPRGSIAARELVVATLLPFVDQGGFFAKTEPSRSYALAAVLDGPAPQGMYISADTPIRSVRPLVLDGEPAIVVSGPSHKPGTESDTFRFYTELEDWVRSNFGVREVTHRWSAQDYRSADDVPYVGRSPRTEHVHVATGFKKWGLSNGTAAAMMLRDSLTGRDNPWQQAFDATRGPALQDVVDLARVNVDVARHAIFDRLQRFGPPAVDQLPTGEGRIVEIDDQSVGAYREHDGTVHAVSLSCTHLGCTVQWNPAERSWDCPCHGSRFDRFGSVLEGPAVESLDSVTAELPGDDARS